MTREELHEAVQPDSPAALPAEKKQRSLRVAAAAIALSALITIAVLAFAPQIERFAELGYLGAFLIMLIGSATIILPAPAFVFVFAMGSVLNPLLLGIAGGVGAALGEMTGYVAGYGGSAPLQDSAVYRRFDRWMDRFGPFAIFFLALIPNPLFDVAGVLAGASHMPVWQFLLACAAGKTIRCILLALGGYYGLTWMKEVFA
ncbi:MAG: VTT domain-containing protein [Anaerolineae bacterium]